MIAGFNSVDGGEICFDDKVINNLEAHKRDIGMVFQNYAIFPHLTVAENVAYGLKAKKYPKDQIPGKVEEALDLVQIKNLKDRKPNELSGGQQQRVALARAFVIEPGVLLMDEPLSNLDAKLRVQMRTVIKKLQRRLGITTIYVTHDQEEALAISDRIAVIKEGEVMQVGSPENIYKKPQNTFVAGLILRESARLHAVSRHLLREKESFLPGRSSCSLMKRKVCREKLLYPPSWVISLNMRLNWITDRPYSLTSTPRMSASCARTDSGSRSTLISTR